jgi:hypothetical protein
VSQEEAQRIRERNAKTACRFGSACTTKDCLFLHPPKEPCRYGSKCDNPICRYAHPTAEEEALANEMAALNMAKTVQEPKPKPLVFPKSEALVKQQEDNGTSSSASAAAAVWHPTVRVPSDVWVEGWKRNPSAYVVYSNPIERFIAVNKTSPKGVLDLHYLTVDEVIDVLARALDKKIEGYDWEFYDPKEETLWIVTGVGSHTLVKGRALIYDVVYDYLDTIGAKFKIAKDNHQNAGGFLLFV